MKLSIAALALLAFTTLSLSTPSWAGKEYTPAQLRKMVSAGKPPKQGPVQKEETRKIEFDKCVAMMGSIANAAKPNYPTAMIVNTKVLWIEKVWSNDAAMTLSCSAPDGKALMTSAPYL